MVDFKKSEDSVKVELAKKEETIKPAIDINATVNKEFSESMDEETKVKSVFKILGVVALTLGLVFGGYKAYDFNKTAKLEQAVVEFDNLQNANASNNIGAMKASATKLMENFSESPLSVRGALIVAKANFDAKDYKSAKAQLDWVIQHSTEADVKILAKLRTAHILIDENQLDQALALLNESGNESYDSLFSDAKADIYALKGDKKHAKEFYQLAISKISDKNSPHRQLIEMKLATVN